MERRSFQLTYFEKELTDKPNIDLIKNFNKNNPGSILKIQTRDITLIKQNLKRKGIENIKAVERVDSIISSAGYPLLVEKVSKLL